MGKLLIGLSLMMINGSGGFLYGVHMRNQHVCQRVYGLTL